MAIGLDWPDPKFRGADGRGSWHSPDYQAKGSEIPEGLVLLVDGAPA
jgi:hypothetical protein